QRRVYYSAPLRTRTYEPKGRRNKRNSPSNSPRRRRIRRTFRQPITHTLCADEIGGQPDGRRTQHLGPRAWAERGRVSSKRPVMSRPPLLAAEGDRPY